MAATLSPPGSPSMSQDSTVFGIDSSTLGLDDGRHDKVLMRFTSSIRRARRNAKPRDILIFLIAFRLLNALSIKTFFQPDEYFQALEPAWQLAFGPDAGAWITWEWKYHLRSAIHPAIFAIVYRVAGTLSWALHLPPMLHARLMIAAPKMLQATFAGMVDYHTWRLAKLTFGEGSNEAWTALALSVANPWHWFCSTRTFSNCIETLLTTVALTFWPWEWSIDRPGDFGEPTNDESAEETGEEEEEQEAEEEEEGEDEDGEDQELEEEEPEEDQEYIHVEKDSPARSETRDPEYDGDETAVSLSAITERFSNVVNLESPLRRCFCFAALACILRPTNVIIWLTIVCYTFFRYHNYGWFMETRWVESPVWINITSLKLYPATAEQRYVLIRQALICGSAVLSASTMIDFWYYGELTSPPLRFLYFNLAKNFAVFYGSNRVDYYLTEGLPLLLTTYVPFAIVGITWALLSPRNLPRFVTSTAAANNIKYQLAATCISVPFFLSFVAHKEVRFIYPLLPLLHIVASTPFTTFFLPAVSPAIPHSSLLTPKRLLLALLLLLNISIAIFASTSHQAAPLSLMTYLRQQHATHYLSQPPPQTLSPNAPSTMTVGLLMPCHSTPWRSHLVFPSIKAWALGCEPPVNLTLAERAVYLDEADQFYASPTQFLKTHLGTPPQPRPRDRTAIRPSAWLRWIGNKLGSPITPQPPVRRGFGREELIPSDVAWDGKPGRKVWPEYLAFFAEKEAVLQELAGARKSAYRECWRGWNSWAHDDWRRRGDVVVWCLRSQKGKRRGVLGWMANQLGLYG